MNECPVYDNKIVSIESPLRAFCRGLDRSETCAGEHTEGRRLGELVCARLKRRGFPNNLLKYGKKFHSQY